jgi:hypothetical protein
MPCVVVCLQRIVVTLVTWQLPSTGRCDRIGKIGERSAVIKTQENPYFSAIF